MARSKFRFAAIVGVIAFLASLPAAASLSMSGHALQGERHRMESWMFAQAVPDPAPTVVTPAPAEPDTTVGLGPLVDYLVVGGGLIIAALAGWLIAKAIKLTGINIDAGMRDSLQTALTNAAGLLLKRAGESLKHMEFDVRNQYVADAIRYVTAAAPDALKKWNLSPEDIAKKLEAKVGLATAAPKPPVDPAKPPTV